MVNNYTYSCITIAKLETIEIRGSESARDPLVFAPDIIELHEVHQRQSSSGISSVGTLDPPSAAETKLLQPTRLLFCKNRRLVIFSADLVKNCNYRWR